MKSSEHEDVEVGGGRVVAVVRERSSAARAGALPRDYVAVQIDLVELENEVNYFPEHEEYIKSSMA